MKLNTIEHKTQLCIVGGGIGGMFAAISAARHGAKVVLMHDRPVLGGNASSEIRMWISGAGTRVRNLQETGILEELLLVRESFGTAVVLVSHNLGLVAAMADRVLVMHRGEIVEQGTPDEVICRPQHAYTRHLIDSVL